ncbi:efflux RND transporter periplasmic adaptor subunit [Acidobacteriota bacterium]
MNKFKNFFKNKKKRNITLFLIIVVIIAGYLLTRSGKERAATYLTAAITKGNIQETVVATGALNPVEIVDVGSQVSGKISEIRVDFNSQVKAGQVIALLEQEIFRTRVNQNQANLRSTQAALNKSKIALETAKKNLERSQELYDKKLLSDKELEDAKIQFYNAEADVLSSEARLEQAQSQVETSEVDLNFTVIKSPIDGTVINRNVNVGQTVAAGMNAPLLFQIARDLTKMQVECAITEADIGKLKERQAVTFKVDAFPNETFTGTVEQVRINPVITQNVVTYITIISVANPERKLLPGMTATTTIVVGEAVNVLLVPNSALRFSPPLEETNAMLQRPGETPEQKPGAQPGQKPVGQTRTRPQGTQQQSRVWTLDENGNLKMIRVQTGVSEANFTEIISGDLKEGDMVISGVETVEQARGSSNPLRRMGF